LNPYGLKGVLFPFTLMTRFQKGNPFAESIGEFVSPFVLRLSDAYPFYPHWPVWTFRILALLALLALIPLLKQRKYWAVLLCLAFFPLAGKMIRNIPLLVIVALPAIAWAMPVSGLWRFGGLRHASARHARLAVLGIAGALTVVLGLRVVTNAYYISTRRADRFGLGWNRLAVPVDAASYINRVGLRGPMLNHLNLGGYLMWAQSARVFIDGRLEVVGEELYERYREVTSSAEDLKRATDHYGFQFAVFPYAVSPRFLGQLSLDPSWRLAYVDALVTVFVRNDGEGERKVDRVSVERRPPAAVGTRALPGLGGPPRRSAILRWLSGVFVRQRFPAEEYNLGLFHYFRKDFSQAEAWFRAALADGGEAYYEVYLNLGSALFQQKKYDEAGACYEVVLQEEPRNKVARERLSALDRLRMQK
jgi:tetratricopeptide (TPR) repeat protein